MIETRKKPLVRLYGADIGVIVMFKSGVLFSNQTGGNYCLQPQEEGVFAPIDDEVFDKETGQLVSLNDLLGAIFIDHVRVGIDNLICDQIDSVLEKFLDTNEFTVDRTRCAESHESWIYIDISERTSAIKNERSDIVNEEENIETIQGFGQCKGVLTWTNSD